MRRLTAQESTRLTNYYRWGSGSKYTFVRDVVRPEGTVLTVGPRGGIRYGPTSMEPRQYARLKDEISWRGFTLIEDVNTRRIHIRSVT